jgi:ribosomal protein S18 acetylase RimI-like enzyme
MIKECNINNLTDIVTIAYKLNNLPERNSAYCFKDFDAIKDDFTQLLINKENLVLGEFDDIGLAGVIGIYVDKDKHTADWIGPFVCRGDYLKIANDMLDYAKKRLPHIKQFHFFFHQRNTECKKLMELNNAEYITNEFNLILNRENRKIVQQKQIVEELTNELKDKVKEIHSVKFVDCFLSGDELIQSDLSGRKVFCITKQEDLAGYGTYHTWKTIKRAAIDILYVKPEFEGCGYEEALLNTLISNIFIDTDIHVIGAVLETKSIQMIETFKKHGFIITAENCSYILRI